jgi:hypothetical protein
MTHILGRRLTKTPIEVPFVLVRDNYAGSPSALLFSVTADVGVVVTARLLRHYTQGALVFGYKHDDACCSLVKVSVSVHFYMGKPMLRVHLVGTRSTTHHGIPYIDACFDGWEIQGMTMAFNLDTIVDKRVRRLTELTTSS